MMQVTKPLLTTSKFGIMASRQSWESVDIDPMSQGEQEDCSVRSLGNRGENMQRFCMI